MSEHSTEKNSWAQLLQQAVETPGLLLEAYTAFHDYSVGNQVLALMQCKERGLTPGPIATYVAWQAKGRQVRKGERALTLCMPITVKAGDDKDERRATRFVYRARWFVISQTDGAAQAPALPAIWSEDRALAALNITRTEFTDTNGNMQGYATGRQIAISPIAQLPHKTLFHELAHVLLDHTEADRAQHGTQLPRNLKEAEAEAVALICCETLALAGAEYARGYIQDWLKGAPIPPTSAQRIFHVADQIIRAGRADD